MKQQLSAAIIDTTYHHKAVFNQPFTTEGGYTFNQIEIAYCTYGKLNEQKSNVIWICHALTANADAADWWSGLLGEQKLFNPGKYFIVCANILGSPYGSTSPLSINPQTSKPYGKDFPLVTPRDLAAAHSLLANHLGITNIYLLTGGSLGGQQAMEWAITQPERIQNLVLLATNARHSAWGIAFNEAQRMAIESGEGGLAAARAIAMLSYRNYTMYQNTQTDEDERNDNFKASSYQRYQGEKLNKRFDADCYHLLSRTMDSHNVGRGRGTAEAALKNITAKTLVISISSDLLFPQQEQEFLATHIPNATLAVINSPYGHDGFLVESEQICSCILKAIF